MCSECDKLQERIEKYNRFIKQRLDPETEAHLKAAVADLENRKAKLH
jgi:cell division protein ZapA (FtsZ GTPase activity inhibitor)